MATFDYTSRDFYSIKEDLLSRAASLPIGADWTTRSASDFGMMLVDLWAYMGDVLHFYVDRAAAETYIRTATQRSSVLALANLLDYEYAPLNSSTAQVTLIPSGVFNGSVTVPAGTSFVAPARSSNEITTYFVSTDSASMSASSAAVTITVVEGINEINEAPIHMVSSNANFSSGTPNQKFSLRYTGVIPSSVSVGVYEGPIVDGEPTAVEYRYVTRLVDLSSYDKAFTVSTSADGLVQIVFGNGINGKVPNAGAEIRVSYRRSSGSAGNIVANRITAFAGTPISNVTIGNSTAATGGYDDESITSLKGNIPTLFRTQDRAVSLQDFKDLALRVPGVVKATATNSGSTVTLYPVDTQTDYTSLSFGSTITIDSSIASETLEYFEPRTMLGASVAIASSVTLTNVSISATVAVKDGYVQRWVKDAVIAKLDEFFTFDNVYFGQTLSLGEVYRAVMSVEGVDYVSITVFKVTGSSPDIATGNKITAASNSLLHKGSDYTITASGGVVG